MGSVGRLALGMCLVEHLMAFLAGILRGLMSVVASAGVADILWPHGGRGGDLDRCKAIEVMQATSRQRAGSPVCVLRAPICRTPEASGLPSP
jgi:hypothetical protein